MAEVEIIYSQLDNASSCAKKCALKCADYDSELKSSLLDKWSCIPATPLSAGASRTDSASYYIGQKRTALKEKQTAYSHYAAKIDDLADSAKTADSNVAKSVNDSLNMFLNEHKNFKGDGWSAFFAGICVDVPAIGWIADAITSAQDLFHDMKSNIRYWYEVLGGKKIIQTALAIGGVVLAAAGLVVAVLGCIGLSSVWAAIVAVAGVIGAVIALTNAITNLVYQVKSDKEEDPAWAQYYGNTDKLSDSFRKETYKSKWMNKYSGGFATALDVTETVCNVINIADGIKSMYGSSGLKALFGDKIKGSADGTHNYKFNFTKFKQTITTSSGRSKIGSTLNKNKFKILFGVHPSEDSLWKAQYKRYQRAAGRWNTTDGKVDMIKLVNGDFGKLKNLFNCGKSYVTMQVYGYSNKEYYNAKKNVYKAVGFGGGVGIAMDVADEI